MEHEEVDVNDYVHTGCYIFRPTTSNEEDDLEQRPRKKRKISKAATLPTTKQDECSWPALLGGQETQAAIHIRQARLQNLWTQHRTKIDEIVNRVDDRFVNDVLEFIRDDNKQGYKSRIKTGLIISGTSKNAQRDLLRGWTSRQLKNDTEILLQLHPSQCPNLQLALKNLIRLAISQHTGTAGYADFLTQQKPLIPMNFDLELLERYVGKHVISRVLVSISDVETFDTAILSELITTVSSWADRVPFILLINIATTVELFESRLSRSTASLLNAKVFELAKDNIDPLYEIYRAVQYSNEPDVFLGTSVLSVLSDLAEDQSTTVATFTRAIKYAFMTHFFANPLSILTSGPELDVSTYKALCQAIRNTAGFQTRCEALLKGNKPDRQKARDLLTSDEALVEDATQAVETGHESLRTDLKVIQLLHKIYNILDLPPIGAFDLEIQLLNSLPKIFESDIYQDIESALERISIERYHKFINELFSTLAETSFATFSANLASDKASGKDTISLHLIQEFISVASDGQPTPLAKWNNPQRPFILLLHSYLKSINTSTHKNPFQAYLSEAFIINTRSPLTTILHARPRYALERALTRPADYLNCECCAANNPHGEIHDRSTLPPTSLLLTLLNEAGNIVNVRDLWDAFHDTLQSVNAEGDEQEDEEPDDRRSLTLFYRALADLRHLGVVRPSKRKPGVDCIAKTAWMGL